MDKSSAITACRNFGNDWSVNKTLDRALVCTKGNTKWNSNCNSCTTWRLLVWENGGWEHKKNYKGYNDPSTVAGYYYAGHLPCKYGDNYPKCGNWTHAGNFDFLDESIF